MNPIRKIEKTTGFERRPAESVSEYLSRLGAGAGVDGTEIESVREAIHTELYSGERPPEADREAIRSFARAVADGATAADVQSAPARIERTGQGDRSGRLGRSAGAGVGGDRGDEGRGEEAVEAAAESLAAGSGESGRSRRKYLAGVGVLGTLGVGAAVATMNGTLGGTEPGGDGTAALGNGSTTTAPGAGTASGTGGDGETPRTTERAPEPAPRAPFSEVDAAVEEFDLEELDREAWPQPVPAECQYDADEVANLDDLVYRDGDSGLDPLASARTLLGVVECYRGTGDDAYLRKASEMAAALYRAGVAYEGGRFFPHEYPVAPHGAEGAARTVGAWFSGRTQGLALSAFARLYAHGLEESVWMYAEETLRSFDSVVTRVDGPPAKNPWTACVDDGHLWIEEYGAFPASHVLGGMGVAAWGLYELWLSVESELARDLFRATATTVKARAEAFRNPGGPSDYCLGHGVSRPESHAVHVEQLRTFHEITGDEAFAAAARRFESDHSTG